MHKIVVGLTINFWFFKREYRSLNLGHDLVQTKTETHWMERNKFRQRQGWRFRRKTWFLQVYVWL